MAKPGPGQSHIALERAVTAPAVSGNLPGGCYSAAQFDFPGGVSMFSGNGAPKLVNGGDAPVVGDLYFRLDGTIGSLIYRCTVASPTAPTWAVML